MSPPTHIPPPLRHHIDTYRNQLFKFKKSKNYNYTITQLQLQPLDSHNITIVPLEDTTITYLDSCPALCRCKLATWRQHGDIHLLLPQDVSTSHVLTHERSPPV